MMEAPIQSPTARKWPPLAGARLFWAWVFGSVVVSFVTHLIFAIVPPAPSTSAGIPFWYVLPPVVVSAWQASLLFSQRPRRFLAWTAVPLLALFFPSHYMAYTYMPLVTPLVEAMLLWGVRRRVWAWIFAGMFAAAVLAVVREYGYAAIYKWRSSVSGLDWIPPMFQQMVRSAPLRGMWIATVAVVAAVLAWKMPPITQRSSEPAS